MAEVGRIKTPSEKRHPFADCQLLHLPMLTLQRAGRDGLRMAGHGHEFVLLALKSRRCDL
jgi:hypothetical protein